MRMRTAILLCVMGLCLVAQIPARIALGAEGESTKAESPKEATPEAVSATYETPLVRYGDLEFNVGYYFYYARISNDKLRMVNRVEGEERQKMIDGALDEILFEHLIARDAEKNGFTKDPEYTANICNMENDWLTRLYDYHLFYQTFKPKEDELQKLYDEKKKDYFKQEQFSFRHIFFRTVDLPEDQQKRARERADAALALIKAGSDFVEVAKVYSDSERKGDVIGPMTPSKYKPEKPMNPAIETALLAMKAGDISDIVPTKYGFEILKMETHTPESYQALDEVKNQLSNELRSTGYEQWKKDILDKNWDEAVKQYNPDLIFAKDADPKAVVFEAFGQIVDVSAYNYLKGQDDKKADETDEAYQQRKTDFLKNFLVYRYIVGKLARDLGYDKIPFYVERTKMIRNFQTYTAWMSRLLKEHLADHPNTEEEKKAFYEENQNRFLKSQTAHIGEMTFNLPPHNKEVLYEVNNAQKAAEAKAKKAIERVKAGEEFAKVAREMSESETAKNGGDLGVISIESSTLPRTIASQAIGLATETVCKEPLQGEDKFFVIMCYDKPPREPIPFSDATVQTSVDRGLTNKKRSEFHQQLMGQLYDKSKMELLYKDIYTCDPVKLNTPSIDLPGAAAKESEKPAESEKKEK